MTPEFVERFRERLESLEKTRLKIVHDRKALLFLMILLCALGLCCLFAGAVGPSRFVMGLGLILLFSAEAVRRSRASFDSAYQILFRERVTRDWFHLRYPGVFLAPAPAASTLPLEITRGLREACIRATAQNPSRTVIEERVFFENDTYHSWSFILKERSRFSSRVHSRALVWFRALNEDSSLVAFVWPAVVGSVSRKADVRFFRDGRVVDAIEPLRQKLVHVYDSLVARASGRAVRVSLSPTGVWAGVRIGETLFAAPVRKSVFDLSAYESWEAEARLPTDREITKLLLGI